jgi:hypothetical protein
MTTSTDPLNTRAPITVNPFRLSDEDYLAWLEQSGRGIGGSDIGALIGVSRWRMPFQVYDRVLGIPQIGEYNNDMRRGVEEEDFAHAAYERQTNRVLRRNGKGGFGHWYRHPEVPFALGSADAVVDAVGGNLPEGMEGDGVVETKTPRDAGRARGEGIDESYYAQLNWYMGIADAQAEHGPVRWGSFNIFDVVERESWIVDVGIDEVLFGQMLEAAERFWNDHVITRRRPEELPADPIAAVVPVVGREYVEPPTADGYEIVERVARARTELKMRETSFEMALQRAKDYMDEHGTGCLIVPGVAKVRWVPNSKGRSYVDQDALLRHLTEQYGPDAAEAAIAAATKEGRPARPFNVYSA